MTRQLANHCRSCSHFWAIVTGSCVVLVSPAASAQSETESFQEIRAEEFRPKLRQPAWDLGFLAGYCAIGTPRPIQRSRFCLGGNGELLFGQELEQEPALGVYAQVISSLAEDIRISAGPTGLLTFSDWLIVQGRVGPLIRLSETIAPGAQFGVEFGQRSLQFDSSYTMTHTLFVNFDWSVAVDEEPAHTALFVGLRVDAYWLTAPAMLFQ